MKTKTLFVVREFSRANVSEQAMKLIEEHEAIGWSVRSLVPYVTLATPPLEPPP